MKTALLAAMLVIAGCGGGGSSNPDSVNQTGPQAAVSTTGIHHYGIDPDARQDYKQAMYDDCVEEIDRASCSVSGRGWFYHWNQLPKVHISANSTPEGTYVIRRALGILNRSLPEEYRLGYETTNRTFSGVDRDDRTSRAESIVPEGVIHAETYSYYDLEHSGWAWTDGNRGLPISHK